MEFEDRITSRANPRFKALKASLAAAGTRRERTLLLGSKLIEAWAEVSKTEAGSRFKPLFWLRREDAKPHPLERRFHLETWILGENLMRDLSEAGSPPDHALLMEVGPEPVGNLPGRVIVPWGIQDPGNLGAILRSAAAFEFELALLGPGCADPFSPKALRGTMGAAFLMPLRRCAQLEPDRGHWYALEGGKQAQALMEADLSEPLRILVGNEGHGWMGISLPEDVRFLAIPTQGVESLNAAVAAGIACYEASRRRK
jgi:RNA methyltransferase, TrmH family